MGQDGGGRHSRRRHSVSTAVVGQGDDTALQTQYYDLASPARVSEHVPGSRGRC